MRAPLSWIREFTPLDAEPAMIAEALDRLGLEVEAIDEPGREVRGVVSARVLEVREHPNADRLTLVDVDSGSGTTTVVCGARNLAAGDVVPFAAAGSRIPGLTLERRKIRGQVSDGMLCSPRELGLGDDHAGILHLDGDVVPGADVRELLGLDDVVFELSITPNRPDAMSIVGVARDLAAHFGLPFAVPEPVVTESGPVTGERVTLVVEAPYRCPRYVARVATVAMGESPEWLARRLTLAGMRPISNVVDVTNYVLVERGQPLHAFDLDRLAGPGVVVRLAADGERMTTLDRVERTLTSADLLICDAERAPQAIAGIMGGGDSEVSEATTSVLIESAYFDPMGIARSSKRLGLRSESSARFERGVDPNGVLAGADRCCELFAAVASATIAPEPFDAYPTPIERSRIAVRTARVSGLLGIDLAADAVREALVPLGIEVEGDGPDFIVVAPTWRPDLEREIDVVEEVGRRVGLDSIPRTLPTVLQAGGLTTRQRERRLVADVLVGMGCAEALTIPLVSPDSYVDFGEPPEGIVQAVNSLRADETVLRPWILPGLLAVAAGNAAHGLADVALFEMGHVFRAPPAGQLLPVERDHVAVLLAGRVRRLPVEPDRPVDVYDLTDIVRALGDAVGLADLGFVSDDAPGFVPGHAAIVVLDGAAIGRVGELELGQLDGPTVALELHLDALFAGRRRDRAFRSPSRFPASGIDLAFVLDEAIPAAAVVATLRETAGALIEDVSVFDEFRADDLGPGRRSLAFALRFRAPDRTLTDTEVGELRSRAIDAVVSAHGATLRG